MTRIQALTSLSQPLQTTSPEAGVDRRVNGSSVKTKASHNPVEW
ncbi:MAG: hypothetical protein QXW58_04465 [Thermosphaera sp.]